MKLDHIVVHVEDDPKLFKQLKSDAERCGFLFNPTRQKANLWVGDQYLEIPKSGGSKRASHCLFLRADNLERLQSQLAVRGVQSSLERSSQKSFFGWHQVTLPWAYLRLPPIPETQFEIGFFEIEAGAVKKPRPKMPAGAGGLVGFGDIDIFLPHFSSGIDFLKKVFPQLATENDTHSKVSLDNSEIHFHPATSGALEVLMDAQSKNEDLVGKSFSFQNVTLRTKPVRST